MGDWRESKGPTLAKVTIDWMAALKIPNGSSVEQCVLRATRATLHDGKNPWEAVIMCSSCHTTLWWCEVGTWYQPTNQNDTKPSYILIRFMHLHPLWYARRPKKPLDCHNPQPDTAQQHRWCSGQDEVTGENRRGGEMQWAPLVVLQE